MPTLDVITSGFHGSYSTLNGHHSIEMSKVSLLAHAVKIGSPILNPGSPTSNHAVSLAAYKYLAIKCAVDLTGPHVTRPTEYLEMDPSEKANISFWTGMVFSSMVAEECLQVSRLVHATAPTHSIAKINPSSRRLADLVGQDDKGQWHVIESKARQANPSPALRVKWKGQSQTILSINGIVPASSSVSFTLVAPVYRVTLDDPESEPSSERIELTLSRDVMRTTYYGPLVEWLSASVGVVTAQRDDVSARMRLAAYDATDQEFLFVGLLEETLEAVKEGRIPDPRGRVIARGSYAGSDGVVVMTSPNPSLV